MMSHSSVNQIRKQTVKFKEIEVNDHQGNPDSQDEDVIEEDVLVSGVIWLQMFSVSLIQHIILI